MYLYASNKIISLLTIVIFIFTTFLIFGYTTEQWHTDLQQRNTDQPTNGCRYGRPYTHGTKFTGNESEQDGGPVTGATR